MKIKKKQFAKLKEITFTVSQNLPGTGIMLEELITDIESVQKSKTIKEEPLTGPFYESLTEEAREMFYNEGKNAIDNNRPIGNMTKGLRAQVKEYQILPGEKPKIDNIRHIKGVASLPESEPMIGDVGYFWDDRYPNVLYTGILSETKIDGSGKVVYYGLKNKNISKDAALFGHFSKTPPELI